ncbi:Protein of unknown function, DUF603 [Borreliella japonica]|uniref:Uncharacterized protein n=1 Tax=Borreliella japonica TaxID=34095 RepID=A0A1G4Q4T8_BORJA|nr:Protein of unknown function, DUF603 [Borreliella japonica]
MKKVKRSFYDYVAYFRERSLNDGEIAVKLGVPRVNVWRVRQKWESGETSVDENSRVTIMVCSKKFYLSGSQVPYLLKLYNFLSKITVLIYIYQKLK